MSRENPLWDAPRIHGELLKLGIDIGETSVSKYVVRRRNPPSQTWRTFLENHLNTTVSIDFFTVPTIRFQVLYGVDRAATARGIPVCGGAAISSARSGWHLRRRLHQGGVEPGDRRSALGSTFSVARGLIERVIGSIRRECIDHMIVLNEASLYRHLKSFMAYYHETKTHLSLEKDSPASRLVQAPSIGSSLPCRKSADCIIGTNVGPRENWRCRELLLTVTSEAHCPLFLGRL
jgi:hypothetical protein